jgi:hypothetical protein
VIRVLASAATEIVDLVHTQTGTRVRSGLERLIERYAAVLRLSVREIGAGLQWARAEMAEPESRRAMAAAADPSAPAEL